MGVRILIEYLTMKNRATVGIVIPTYNGEHLLPRLLGAINSFAWQVSVLVIDSSSTDGTVNIAQAAGAKVNVIKKSEFNHGSTRDLGRMLINADIVVMMTQDVIPAGPEMLDRLVSPILAGQAAVSYARQIPHDGAGFFESFPRFFNYPNKSELRGFCDVKHYGAYTFYCSNSCAAWSNSALDEIGGFGSTLSLEDTVAVAKLLRKGYKVAYCADAVVKHSHKLTMREEYRRHFDVGFIRRAQRDLLMVGSGDEARGALYVSAMLKALLVRGPHLMPYAVLIASAKWLGYRAGWYSASVQ